MTKVKRQVIKKDYALYHGDSVEVIKDIPDDSIGYSLYSPPFADLYTFSDSPEDLSNCKNYNEFFYHYDFLIREQFRTMMPGRSVSIHCRDLPYQKSKDGFIGLRDFSGDVIKHFIDAGFIYHSSVIVWKDPLIEALRTKTHSLMYKQIKKDSAICRQGTPDKIITMRKPGDNYVPIRHEHGLDDYAGSDSLPFKGDKLGQEVWRRYASPVWMDVRQTRVLNYRGARTEKDEKHISVLQLDVIQRCMTLWSSPGDTFFTPFGGIGSEPYVGLKMGLKVVGVELKDNYFDQMVNNCKKALKEKVINNLPGMGY